MNDVHIDPFMICLISCDAGIVMLGWNSQGPGYGSAVSQMALVWQMVISTILV